MMSFPTLYASKLAIFPAAADATPPVSRTRIFA
jgi:hypothetical protein